MTTTPSTRAQVVTRRTYNRPLDEAGTDFETWQETVGRVLLHQRWLWERAAGRNLTSDEQEELMELGNLMLDRKALPSGRTLWLGGTDVAKRRESSMFNCSFERIETVHDVVDAFWLLLQGCGVGFMPVAGTLNGFAQPVEIEVWRSEKDATVKGYEYNRSTYYHDTWRLSIGDSAEAWTKALGKVLAQKNPLKKIIIDTREVRGPGARLKGYGWISSGDETLVKAMLAICEIMNHRAGQLLTVMDIHDILNWMGTTLSSRRSAEISLLPADDPDAETFARCKDHFWEGNPQRAQSNNSLVFYRRPEREQLERIFETMAETGGSEPGFINAEAAKRRAPWFKGVNPCAEILLGNKSFCNLVEVDLGKFNDNWDKLLRALWLIARANYRQTCVNLDDGILQRSWHELNEFLRLCGVGLTGIVTSDYINAESLQTMREVARRGADDIADELGLPRAKAVTTVKPSGTLSKIMDTTEGVHRPLGRFIFNNVTFSRHDPIVEKLRAAGYRVMDKPFESDSVLVTFPVEYSNVDFHLDDNWKAVNLESAVSQLERYKLLMENYVDHNCSITVSYSPEEVPQIIDWLMENWDHYVGVSWLYRNDPSKTAEDLGYPYLPQEVVTEAVFRAYEQQLGPVNLDGTASFDEIDDGGCSTGGCPIR